MMRGLLVVERHGQQCRLGKRTAYQFNADRESTARETSRHGDRRETCVRGERGIAAGLCPADHRRDAADCRIGDGVEAIGIHHRRECLAEGVACREPGCVVLAREVVVGDGVGDIEDALERRGVEPGLEQVVNRRGIPAGALEIVPEIKLQLLRQQVRRRDELRQIGHFDVDCRGAASLHLVDRPTNDVCHVCVLWSGAEEFGEHADASTLQRPSLQRRDIGSRQPSAARGGRGIRSVVADGFVEDDRDVLDGSCHRAAGVLGVAERNDAGAARQTQRRTKADDRVVRARDADSIRSCRCPS